MLTLLRDPARVVQIAQYEFFSGHLGTDVLTRHHRLELRVLDYDGYLTRHNDFQDWLSWCQQKFAHSTFFGFIKDWARKLSEKNSRALREFLLRQLLEGRVYLKTLDLNTGWYQFRLVRTEEIPVLRHFLEEQHVYQLYFRQGDDPTVMSLVHLGTFQA